MECRNVGKTANVIIYVLQVVSYWGMFLSHHLVSKLLSPIKPHPHLKSDVCNLIEPLPMMLELRKAKITDHTWPLLVFTDGLYWFLRLRLLKMVM